MGLSLQNYDLGIVLILIILGSTAEENTLNSDGFACQGQLHVYNGNILYFWGTMKVADDRHPNLWFTDSLVRGELSWILVPGNHLALLILFVSGSSNEADLD